MNGFFNIKKFSSNGAGDDFFKSAIKDGSINNILDKLELKQEARCSNRIFDNVAAMILDRLFGLPDCTDPYYLYQTGVDRAAPLTFLALLDIDSNTDSYIEDWSWTGVANLISNIVSSTALKSFYIDAFSSSIERNATRDEVYYLSRYLYLPSEAISDDIRSVGIYWRRRSSNDLGSVLTNGRVGRVRIKDLNGNNVELTKNAEEVLLFDYTFKLISV
jgi:hypothetical protein